MSALSCVLCLVRTKLYSIFIPFSYRYGLLQLFLPKRMKRRVEMPSSKADQKAAEETVGRMDCIPVGFDDLNGTIDVDLMAERLSTESMDSSS